MNFAGDKKNPAQKNSSWSPVTYYPESWDRYSLCRI